ncbi:MAG: GDP-mannose 4,6-dehydratase, partial [Bacteroidales bacterium]|nr:GDP-mannose 4,6-dehydratase [Bacteroidales bacterium]
EKGICVADRRAQVLGTARQASSQAAGCAPENGTGLDTAADRANAQATGLPGSSLEGRTLVEVDPKYFRPAEVDQLLGDPSKARKALGWNPRKTSFEELVKIMVKHDLEEVGK